MDTGETFSTSYDVATKVGILRNVTLNNPTTNGWIPRGVTVVVTDDGASMRERRVREEPTLCVRVCGVRCVCHRCVL